MQYDIPILFVIFRRKDVTMRTFAAIKAKTARKTVYCLRWGERGRQWGARIGRSHTAGC